MAHYDSEREKEIDMMRYDGKRDKAKPELKRKTQWMIIFYLLLIVTGTLILIF